MVCPLVLILILGETFWLRIDCGGLAVCLESVARFPDIIDTGGTSENLSAWPDLLLLCCRIGMLPFGLAAALL